MTARSDCCRVSDNPIMLKLRDTGTVLMGVKSREDVAIDLTSLKIIYIGLLLEYHI